MGHIVKNKYPTEAVKLEFDNMDIAARTLVRGYIIEHLDLSDDTPDFDVYIVWKCKILQHWKFLISSTLPDGMYYEVTYNGDKHEWYFDAYKKFENRCIEEELNELWG